MLDFVGPWPTTCITSGSLTNASMIGCGVLAADEDVDVLGRLAAAAEAAAQLGADHAGHRPDLLEQRQAERQRLVDPDAVADRAEEARSLRGSSACVFAPKPLSLATSPPRTRPSASSMVSIFRAVVQGLHLLRPEARQAQHLDQPGGDRRAEVVEVRQPAGRDERGDLLLQRLADAADARPSCSSATICLRSPSSCWTVRAALW